MGFRIAARLYGARLAVIATVFKWILWALPEWLGLVFIALTIGFSDRNTLNGAMWNVKRKLEKLNEADARRSH